MQLKKITYAITAIISATLLSGCNSNDGDTHTPLKFSFGMENTSAVANNNNIPLPNDLYFLIKKGKDKKTWYLGWKYR